MTMRKRNSGYIGTARIRDEIGCKPAPISMVHASSVGKTSVMPMILAQIEGAARTMHSSAPVPLESTLARMVGAGKRAAVPRAPSAIEEMFAIHARAAQLPAPAREFQFDASRRWRFDFAWPDAMIAVEVEGGTHAGGRHTRGDGYARDCEKYNAATLAGWRLLRFPGEHVRSGAAIATVLRAFGR